MTAPIYYIYDKNKILAGSAPAQKNYRENGKYFPIANGTLSQPQKGQKNQVNRYLPETDEWELIPNFVGTEYWVSFTEKAIISNVGETMAGLGGYETKEEAFAALPQEEQDSISGDNKVSDAKTQLTESLSGIELDLGGGRVIQLRAIDRSNIRDAINYMQRHDVTTRRWKMADNLWYDITLDELTSSLESGQDELWQINSAWEAAENA